MKKFLNSLFAILLIIGIAGAAASFSNAMIAFNGDTVSLNEAAKSDFDKKAKIEGEIYYVYDCIAVEEVTHTTYGVKTGTDETNFYLIESYNKDWYTNDSDYEPLTLIYSTADKDKIEKLDKMIEDWYDYEEKLYNAETTEDAESLAIPEGTLDIVGIIDEYDDDKLYTYRDEYIEEIGYTGDDLDDFVDEYCVDMIIKDTDPSSSRNLFIAAVIVAVVGLIGLIAVLVGGKKKKNSEELY